MNKEWQEKLEVISDQQYKIFLDELAKLERHEVAEKISQLHYQIVIQGGYLRLIKEVVIPEAFKAGANKEVAIQDAFVPGTQYYKDRNKNTPSLDQFIKDKLG